jgi:hypothetical protein
MQNSVDIAERTPKLSGRDLFEFSQIIEQRLCLLQISGLEPFGEAIVDRLEERYRFSGTARTALRCAYSPAPPL